MAFLSLPLLLLLAPLCYVLSLSLSSNLHNHHHHHHQPFHHSQSTYDPNNQIHPPPKPDQLHWIFLYYHKTGHNFVTHLSMVLHGRCHVSIYNTPDESKRVNDIERYVKEHKILFSYTNVLNTVPGTYIADWKKVFSIPGHQFRIAHFVRDPLDLVLSAYLFHTQNPPPEVWIMNSTFNYCYNSHMKQGDRVVEALSLFHGNESEVNMWIKQAFALCEQSRTMFPPQATYQDILHHAIRLSNNLSIESDNTAVRTYFSNLNFYHHNTTNEIDLYPAIRIEVLHSLFGEHGDLLNMAVSKLYEHPAIAKSFSLDNFGIANNTKFRAAADEMIDFLMPNKQCRSRLCKCTNHEGLVNITFAASYVSENAIKQSTSNISHHNYSHYTFNMISKETKNTYKDRLLSDPIVGPLLSLISRIVHFRPANSSMRIIDSFLSATSAV
jgi:hypothetical protein